VVIHRNHPSFQARKPRQKGEIPIAVLVNLVHAEKGEVVSILVLDAPIPAHVVLEEVKAQIVVNERLVERFPLL
jgi:hypothetical protein